MHRAPLSTLLRFALVVAGVLASFVAPSTAAATGLVLVPSGAPDGMSVRMAIALGPDSTTRWSEVTLPPGPAFGWLVPMRPGAAVEWAPSAWLSSLDNASAPRVLVPDPVPCALHQTFESPDPWVRPASSLGTAPIALPASAADAEAWATGHGLPVDAGAAQRLRDLYASGWHVAAIELGASDRPRSSPTLRVTDDGGAILPLTLAAPQGRTPLTLLVVAAGHASIAGAREIHDAVLRWSATGSSYADLRQRLVGVEGWLLESSSHEGLFDSIAVTSSRTVPPVVTTYFDAPACAAAVKALGSHTTVEDPASLTCGTHTDLALALEGIAPKRAVLTRLVAALPAGRPAGTPAIVLASGPERSPVRSASGFDGPCPSGTSSGGIDVDFPDAGSLSSSGSPSSSGYPGYPGYPSSSGTSSSSSTVESAGETDVYVVSDGCGGSSATVVEEDDEDTWDDTDSSSDACSGDTSSSSDGWDESDSSSDACSGDTSSSDGWDSSDSSSCSTARKTKRHGPSPLSRVILLAVAMLLPLRRLSRPRPGGRT